MKELKIESNIPIPNYKSNNSVRSVVEKMKVEDSVLVETYTQASYVGQAIRKSGFLAVTRKLDDGKVRVWKVKRKKT